MKKLAAVLFITFFLFCQVELPISSNITADSYISQEKAIEIAQGELADGEWSPSAKVTKAFPIHTDGVNEISYWECKVVDEKGPAGFVLVNANRTDLLVVEAATEGFTLYEQYAQKLPNQDFKLLRYDWFRSVALSPEGKILSSVAMGDDKEQVRQAMNDFRVAMKEQGEKTVHLGGDLASYYAELDASEPNIRLGFIDNAFAGKKTRVFRARLKKRFPGGHHTPRWHQFQKDSGAYVGCGPVAWAVLYAYWQQFLNKGKLFNGKDLKPSVDFNPGSHRWLKNIVMELNRNCKTSEVRYQGKKQGYTPPKRMELGINYAKGKGYKKSTAGRWRGTEFNKFAKVKSHIAGNKPVILLIKNSGRGIPNHYVVIEGAYKYQRKRLRKWRDWKVKYLVNKCNGGPSTYIFVREVGINKEKIYTAGSAYLVNVR